MTNKIDIPSEPRAAVDALANHLTATVERPIPPATNRWLGEVKAVACDATSDDLPEYTATYGPEDEIGALIQYLEIHGEIQDGRLPE